MFFIYFSQTDSADVPSVCRSTMPTTNGSRQRGTQALHSYPTIHCVCRRRRDTARGGACVVISDGVQNGDNGGNEEPHKSADAESNQAKLS